MNIIISDTNVISDLYAAGLLDKALCCEHIYVVNLVREIEFNSSTCDIVHINQMREKELTSDDLLEVVSLLKTTKGLSKCDLMNYVVTKRYNGILLTGDKRLKSFATDNNVKVKGTIWLLEYLCELNYITKKELLNSYSTLLENNERLPKNELYKRINEINNEICA